MQMRSCQSPTSAERHQPPPSLSEARQRTRHGLAALLLLSLFGSQSLSGCNNGQNIAVELRISVSPSTPPHDLIDVSAIMGSDKFHWQRIPSGTSESVELKPAPQDERQLTLIYHLDGRRFTWESPNIPGNAPHRINLAIESDGTVKHEACRLPCEDERRPP